MADKNEILARLEKIHNLPTLPQIIERLGKAIRDPDADSRAVSRIIEDDPSMMARILKVVNSAFYGVSEPIHSVHSAVARMGFIAVNNIAMSTAVFSTFSRKGQTDFSREDFWRHSICAGLAANILYKRSQSYLKSRFSKDVLHLAGLLHDVGKIIFEQFMHAEFIKSIQVSTEKNIPLFQAELEVMGIDHCEVGAWLGKKWNLSEELVEIVRWHHDPAKVDKRFADLVNIIHIANYICNLEKLGNSGDSSAPAFQHAIWKQLGLAVQDISEIVDAVKEESKHSEILLSFM